MRIDSNKSKISYLNHKNDISPQKCDSIVRDEPRRVVPSSEHCKAYSNISFRGKVYDGTNFREELKKRAEHSTTRMKLFSDFKLEQNKQTYMYQMSWDNDIQEQELTLYKTKHNEYIINPATDKIYKLKFVDDKERITQQVMASKLYNSVGVRTPEYIPFEQNGKTGWLVEIFEERLEPQETNKKALYESFVADVWLGNRNGLSKENTKIDKDGNPVKMSVSGSLGYRASGKEKDDKISYEIPEIVTMRDYSKNPDAASALKDMTDEELYDAIKSVSEKYSYSQIDEITHCYRHDKLEFDLNNLLSNRMSKISAYVKQNKDDKVLRSRGLLEEDHPKVSNLKYFKPNDSWDRKYALEITDEQWQKLKERGLLQKEIGYKQYSITDLKNLAQMTDEQHKKAQERGLYCSGIAEFDRSLGGYDIKLLAELPDENWKNIKRNKLLDVEKKFALSGWAGEFIAAVSDIDEYDWNLVLVSRILYAHTNANQVKTFLERYNSPETNGLVPSYLERMQILSLIDKDKISLDKNYSTDKNLQLAEISNKNWQRLLEITKNFTDTKMPASDFFNIFELDDESYNRLKSRGMLDEATIGYGLQDLAVLSDEDWKKIDERGIRGLKDQSYSDWAHLASMSDEHWQIAKDKKLFANRSNSSKYPDYLHGEDIALIVDSLDEKDWENLEKRRLFSDYRAFNGFGWGPAHPLIMIKLAKLSDNEFEKFNKVSSSCTIYPSTVFDLLTLNEEQFQRLFDRNLFKFINTHEAWDNYTEDAPIMMALAELSNQEYQSFLNQTNSCKTIAAKTLIVKAEKLGLDKKHNLNEFSIKEKREYLQLLLKKGYVFFSNDFKNNFNCTEIVPKTEVDYNILMKKLIKSVGIDTKPILKSEKEALFDTLDSIFEPNSEFRKLDIKNLDFKLTLKYSRRQFKNDILNIVKHLDEAERAKVWDYFGFEIKQNRHGCRVMSGYPSLINNGEKLAEIDNPETKLVIAKIKPYVKAFTEENKIVPDKRFISKNMANKLNNIFNALPELYTIVGKEQHGTHDYTVDVHTLAVLQECINNPHFEHLNKEEKHTLILTALLHDITKEEYSIDKAHPVESSFDAYYILEKLGLPKQQHKNIYQLIKNHDMLEHCNKGPIDPKTGVKLPITDDEQNKKIKKYAYEFRSDNLGELALMLTKADLLGVTRCGYFYDLYCSDLNKVSHKLRNEIRSVKATSIPLPQTAIPSASNLNVDGENVKEITTYDSNGAPIKNKVIYMRKGLDLSKYGFAKGVTSENFNVIIHGFDTESQQIVLDSLELANQDALLSSSYVVYDKGNYRAFRQQGFIKEVQSDDIGAAYYRDFGSGCKKTTESLISNYLNGNCITYRNYVPKLIKETLNLTDDEYIALYNEIKNKPMEVIEKELPHVAYALKDIFAKMEVHKRKFQRNYNEALITKGENKAIYFYGENSDKTGKYEAENLPEFLRKYAQDNDIPLIYFGE